MFSPLGWREFEGGGVRRKGTNRNLRPGDWLRPHNKRGKNFRRKGGTRRWYQTPRERQRSFRDREIRTAASLKKRNESPKRK